MPKRNGSMAIDLVTDLFNTINNYDTAIVFSGNAELERPLMTLRSRGKDFYVVSHPDAVSKEIMELAGNHFIDISTMEKFVRLQQRPVRQYIPAIS
jgi:uncharacterized LabA/DUF88 family protein